MNLYKKLRRNLFYTLLIGSLAIPMNISLDKKEKTPQQKQRELREFFESFDKDKNSKLDIFEMTDFYDWVKKNIRYRFDDEQKEMFGDGREGNEYRQHPYETLEERAGDCEDLATLELAIYRHFGLEAYISGVNEKKQEESDHVVTIVWMGNSLRDYVKVLGRKLSYYRVKDSDKIVKYQGISRISHGYYMIVDHAYSRKLGSIEVDFPKDRFRLFYVASLEGPYGSEWNEFTSQVGRR